MSLYPIRQIEGGDYEVRLPTDWWPLAEGSVVLFSATVAPTPGCWVMYRRRGRDALPRFGTWPTPGGRAAWMATATEVLHAPTPDEIQATKDRNLRSWGLRRSKTADGA